MVTCKPGTLIVEYFTYKFYINRFIRLAGIRLVIIDQFFLNLRRGFYPVNLF